MGSEVLTSVVLCQHLKAACVAVPVGRDREHLIYERLTDRFGGETQILSSVWLLRLRPVYFIVLNSNTEESNLFTFCLN